MSVRAKFRVQSIERTMATSEIRNPDTGQASWVPREVHTVTLTPVSKHSDPDNENNKFWASTPSGQIKIGSVNSQATVQFELEKEYYVDFTQVEG